MARSTLHGMWERVRTKRLRLAFVLGFALALIFLSSHSSAHIDLTIFGPKCYDRLKGKPTVCTDSFERCNPAEQAVLHVRQIIIIMIGSFQIYRDLLHVRRISIEKFKYT